MNRRPHPYQGCALPTELPGLVSSRPLFCLATTAGTSGGAGAGNGIRTRDPQLGRLMLCQLSYSRPNPVLATVGRGRYAHRPSNTRYPAPCSALPRRGPYWTMPGGEASLAACLLACVAMLRFPALLYLLPLRGDATPTAKTSWLQRSVLCFPALFYLPPPCWDATLTAPVILAILRRAARGAVAQLLRHTAGHLSPAGGASRSSPGHCAVPLCRPERRPMRVVMEGPLAYFRPLPRATGNWWRGVDSNHRRLKPTDLQSAPFDRSGTSPIYFGTGAGDGTRTRNLLITNQLLCQLSYASSIRFLRESQQYPRAPISSRRQRL